MYSDFTSGWYSVVGTQIVMTMAIGAFMPFVTYGVAWSVLKVQRYLDSKSDAHTTKKVTIQDYIMLYSGPEVLLDI